MNKKFDFCSRGFSFLGVVNGWLITSN